VKQHLLIFRFSALGDILMSVPVIDALARQYPELQITVVSRPYVGPVMRMLPQNVSFFGVNLKNYKGISGIHKLYKELKTLQPSAIADFHNVLRTILLRVFFKLGGIKTAYLNKDRLQRKRFIKAEVKTQQRTSFEGYQQVLAELGFPVNIDWHQRFSLFGTDTKENAIGVAPFAAHRGKIYPLDQLEKVVAELSKQVHVYLFGAGAEEKALMEQWEKKYDNVESVVGRLADMGEELRLMSRLRLVLSMDSGNMHLASLAGVPVVSIWGATHPLGGFLGWGQPMENVIQEDLPCRPCSIYGNKPCCYGDYRCLTGISPERVIEAVKRVLQQ
jgi:ADP-heptose:LPS heptosyltransferase